VNTKYRSWTGRTISCIEKSHEKYQVWNERIYHW
jgi:hypothetical protein